MGKAFSFSDSWFLTNKVQILLCAPGLPKVHTEEQLGDHSAPCRFELLMHEADSWGFSVYFLFVRHLIGWGLGWATGPRKRELDGQRNELGFSLCTFQAPPSASLKLQRNGRRRAVDLQACRHARHPAKPGAANGESQVPSLLLQARVGCVMDDHLVEGKEKMQKQIIQTFFDRCILKGNIKPEGSFLPGYALTPAGRRENKIIPCKFWAPMHRQTPELHGEEELFARYTGISVCWRVHEKGLSLAYVCWPHCEVLGVLFNRCSREYLQGMLTKFRFVI